MTKANEFLQALRGPSGREQSVDDYWKRQKTEWLEDLRALRTSMRAWMRPILEAGFATVADMDFPTTEPDLGTYAAPGLVIELLGNEPRRALVRPRGLRVVGVVESGGARIIGARGRVDLECGAAREILLRFKDEAAGSWCSFAGGTKRELDEELFFDLLARTADVTLR